MTSCLKHYVVNRYTVGPDVEEIQKKLYTSWLVKVAFTVHQVKMERTEKIEAGNQTQILRRWLETFCPSIFSGFGERDICTAALD
jgi:hypothetical protein